MGGKGSPPAHKLASILPKDTVRRSENDNLLTISGPDSQPNTQSGPPTTPHDDELRRLHRLNDGPNCACPECTPCVCDTCLTLSLWSRSFDNPFMFPADHDEQIQILHRSPPQGTRPGPTCSCDKCSNCSCPVCHEKALSKSRYDQQTPSQGATGLKTPEKPIVFPGLHVKRDIDNRPTWQKTNPSAVLLIEESKRRAAFANSVFPEIDRVFNIKVCTVRSENVSNLWNELMETPYY